MATNRLWHNGCEIAFQVAGSGPPVILIQGVGIHGSGWLPQVKGLASTYECLTFDNRGIGMSQPAAESITVEQMAADAVALMNSQGWHSAHVVGHSLGGLVALRLALDSPERVKSLALLCTFSNGADATRLTPWMLWVGLRSRIGTRRQRRNAFLQLVLPPDDLKKNDRAAVAEELGHLFGHDLADQPPVAMRQLNAMRSCNLTSRLSELGKIPTLVVSARHDRIARPEFGRTLAQGIPGAQFVELIEASHGAPIQHDGKINALLLDHLARAGRLDAQ
jgi:pimeloyl-ACP methyl ester carboxylesterase